MLNLLKDYDCINLICDEKIKSFYKKFNMLESSGMFLRKYLDK